MRVSSGGAGSKSWSEDRVFVRAFNASRLALSSLQPAGGPISGGTRLTVYGETFIPSGDCRECDVERGRHFRCHFAPVVLGTGGGTDSGQVGDRRINETVPASVVGERAVRCRSPSRTAGRSYVWLSYAGHPILTTGASAEDGGGGGGALAYDFYGVATSLNLSESGDGVARSLPLNATATTLLSLRSVQPAGGPAGGGTTVTIRATGMGRPFGGTARDGTAVHGAYCRFSPPALEATGRQATAVSFSRLAAAENHLIALRTEQLLQRELNVSSIEPLPAASTAALLRQLDAQIVDAAVEVTAAREAIERPLLHGLSQQRSSTFPLERLTPPLLEGGAALESLQGFVPATIIASGDADGVGTATCTAPSMGALTPPYSLRASVTLILNADASAQSNALPYVYYNEVAHVCPHRPSRPHEHSMLNGYVLALDPPLPTPPPACAARLSPHSPTLHFSATLHPHATLIPLALL